MVSVRYRLITKKINLLEISELVENANIRSIARAVYILRTDPRDRTYKRINIITDGGRKLANGSSDGTKTTEKTHARALGGSG